ncbi:hypothetical protein MWU65_17325 [Cellulophaga sp. F20128]|uniref:hypothetical protein n=1 Tax=Cellulophaga sp. F20128 TaxID=2926413 RepID=UPI001FF20EB3|nr:hypothetical protein [Cellulophaga sp. F20128]MCK0158952.1 hypothetical protein [Cellulophaga sp. F20128]
MKLNLWNIILIITLLFGCQNEQKLDGNYSMCNNGEYTEVYFKKDSMRVASENKWVKLSEWRKFEIKNDTLYFQSFGEWRDDWKAEIIYNGKNKTELHNLITDVKFNLERINENPHFENLKEFWNEFSNRQKIRNCE